MKELMILILASIEFLKEQGHSQVSLYMLPEMVTLIGSGITYPWVLSNTLSGPCGWGDQGRLILWGHPVQTIAGADHSFPIVVGAEGNPAVVTIGQDARRFYCPEGLLNGGRYEILTAWN